MIRIPKATSLHVKITSALDGVFDRGYIYSGVYTGTINYYSTGYSARLTDDDIKTYEYTIMGDTVTIAFYLDDSRTNYGYYAVITADITNIKNGYLEKPVSDNRDCGFSGWTSEPDGNEIIEESNLSNYQDVYAQYNDVYTFTNWDGIEWKYRSQVGELVIGNGTLEDKERKKSDYPWDSFRSDIKKVITDGAPVMNGSLEEMFADCYSLTSADIRWDMKGASDTSQMFENCLSLSEITIGENASIHNSGICGSRWEKDGVRISSEELMSTGKDTYHLVPCYAILYDDGSLVIQDSDTTDERTVITMWEQIDAKQINKAQDVPWHKYRDQIKSVQIDSTCIPFNVDYWFYNMINCTEMDLTQLDTRNVEKMDNMFSRSKNLTKITIGDNFSFKGKADPASYAVLPGNFWKKDDVRISSEELKNKYNSTMAGTYIRDDYWAILYEDGEMVMQFGETSDGRTVVDKWSGFETTKFETPNDIPWLAKVNYPY